ncbi:hypothetical protein BT96DRAFT_981664 [Gymnopus androsaceus JB14]|uniref:Uncharacterized protein n=1 Tax=Gymnopus androsaceus JB14 TaxID=1447944 RepID=A0A6A4GN30_9AGAR|nr:hypothetical protein BT96DRAFT_981664 [Gymnopus androsaceus JB14]
MPMVIIHSCLLLATRKLHCFPQSGRLLNPPKVLQYCLLNAIPNQAVLNIPQPKPANLAQSMSQGRETASRHSAQSSSSIGLEQVEEQISHSPVILTSRTGLCGQAKLLIFQFICNVPPSPSLIPPPPFLVQEEEMIWKCCSINISPPNGSGSPPSSPTGTVNGRTSTRHSQHTNTGCHLCGTSGTFSGSGTTPGGDGRRPLPLLPGPGGLGPTGTPSSAMPGSAGVGGMTHRYQRPYQLADNNYLWLLFLGSSARGMGMRVRGASSAPSITHYAAAGGGYPSSSTPVASAGYASSENPYDVGRPVDDGEEIVYWDNEDDYLHYPGAHRPDSNPTPNDSPHSLIHPHQVLLLGRDIVSTIQQLIQRELAVGHGMHTNDRRVALAVAKSLQEQLWFFEVEWGGGTVRDESSSFTQNQGRELTELPTGIITALTKFYSPDCVEGRLIHAQWSTASYYHRQSPMTLEAGSSSSSPYRNGASPTSFDASSSSPALKRSASWTGGGSSIGGGAEGSWGAGGTFGIAKGDWISSVSREVLGSLP